MTKIIDSKQQYKDNGVDYFQPSLNFAQGYLQKKKLVFTGNKGQNLPDFGLYY